MSVGSRSGSSASGSDRVGGGPVYDHLWRWKTVADPWRPGQRVAHPLAARAGQACRVLARGGMNSVLVEFPDGHLTVGSRYAVRRTPRG